MVDEGSMSVREGVLRELGATVPGESDPRYAHISLDLILQQDADIAGFFRDEIKRVIEQKKKQGVLPKSMSDADLATAEGGISASYMAVQPERAVGALITKARQAEIVLKREIEEKGNSPELAEQLRRAEATRAKLSPPSSSVPAGK